MSPAATQSVGALDEARHRNRFVAFLSNHSARRCLWSRLCCSSPARPLRYPTRRAAGMALLVTLLVGLFAPAMALDMAFDGQDARMLFAGLEGGTPSHESPSSKREAASLAEVERRQKSEQPPQHAATAQQPAPQSNEADLLFEKSLFSLQQRAQGTAAVKEAEAERQINDAEARVAKLLTEGKRPRVEEMVRSMLSEDPELVQAVRRADSERLKKMARAEARRILGNEDGEKRLAELEADFQ
jgi:hypothetical protein